MYNMYKYMYIYVYIYLYMYVFSQLVSAVAVLKGYVRICNLQVLKDV